MQTIERKPSALKAVHLDQCNKLQQKYQQDIELLDDLRLFMRQRAVIEKVYAQSLCKLVQQFLVKRQFPAKPATEPVEDETLINRTLLEVWKTVLDETQATAMVRLAAAETYLMKISEQCKQVRANRSQISKMVFDELNSLQKDLSMSLQEVSKSQKVYREEEHVAHDARVKAEAISNKVKNKSVGRFTSLAKLQQQSSKMDARVEACEVKSTAARNEYILNLRAANAHLHRYYNVDIPDLLQILDGEYYDVWKYLLSLFATVELQCSSATTQCFTRVASEVNTISQKYNTDGYLKENPVLTDAVQYQFVPQDNDPISKVCKAHQAELDLDREARKWATKIARENRTIRRTTKALSSANEENNAAVRLSLSEALFSPQLAASEAKLEEDRSKLRLAELGKAKAEARIEALREGGVEVDVWLNSANADLVTEEEDGPESVAKTGNSSSVKKVESTDGEFIHSPYASVDECQSDLQKVAGSKRTVYPIWCVAVYDYEAVNEDELSMTENENLEVLGEEDGDGWLRARNSQGTEGLVPENYIRVWNPVVDGGSVDVNEENVDDGTLVPYAVNNARMNTIERDVPPVPYAVNNSLMNVCHKAQLAQNPLYAEVPNALLAEGEKWTRALFDYEATCDEELSFQEGQLIRVLSTQHDGVDDGWWQGEINGSVGLFPSLVVEELLPLKINDQETSPSHNPSANVYGNVESVQLPGTYLDGSFILNTSSHPQQQENGSQKPKTVSPNVQSLFNDGTESAV